MSLTFYPIEDASILQSLRSNLSPFLKTIQKCSSNTENEQRTKEGICDEIINTASSSVDNQLRNDLSGLMQQGDQRTLNYEHDALGGINRKLVDFITTFINYLKSSFQHYNLFKRTSHLTQEYRQENSLITGRARSQGKINFFFFNFFIISTRCQRIHMLGVLVRVDASRFL